MAEYDGKIKVGIDFGTKAVRDSLRDLNKELESVKHTLKTLNSDFARTSDTAAFNKQSEALDVLKSRLVVAAKEYQTLSDIIQKSGSSWGSNKVLEGMANSYKAQFSRIMRDALDFSASLKSKLGNFAMGDVNVGYSLDKEKFNKFVSDISSNLSNAASKTGKEFNIKPNVSLDDVESEMLNGKSSYRVIAEAMNFSDLGADIKRDFIGNLKNAELEISKVQSSLNSLSGAVKSTYDSETFAKQYVDLRQIASTIPELQNKFIQLLGVVSQLYDGKLPSSARNIANSFNSMSNSASKSISKLKTTIESNLNSDVLNNIKSFDDSLNSGFSFNYDDSVVRNLVDDLQRELNSADLNVKVDLDSIELGVDHVDTGGVLSVIKANTERISNSIPKYDGAIRHDYSSDKGVSNDTLNTDNLIKSLEQEQLNAVNKFNDARAKGLDITQALTQDELALTKAYYEGLKLEEKRNQERKIQERNNKEQQKNAALNAKVDKVVSSAIIDLPKEESKLERLHRLAGEIKFGYANREDINQIRSKFSELKRLASEIRVKFVYDNNLSDLSKQVATAQKAAEGIKFNFAKNGDTTQAQKGVDALKRKIEELKNKRDSLNDAYNKGIIDEIEFRADTADVDKAIDELESETIQIEADITASNSPDLNGLGSIRNLATQVGSNFLKVKGAVTGVVNGIVTAFKGVLKVSDFFNDSLKKAVSRMKSFNDTLKDTVISFAKLTKGAFDFMHDMTSVLPIASSLKESLNNIGFGDLVGADLLANAIREATNALKEFEKSSLDEGGNFQSAYLRIKDTFGDARDEIYKFARTAKDNLGMSETQYLLAAGKIGVFARSYIKDTDELAKVTNALSLSIADLSAQAGFSIDETMTKVLSGLRGNTEAIEELGVNVKVKDMQTWLDNQGINAEFKDLDSNMQNLYRTWYMLDKVATNGAMGYAAKMMNTYSGQVRILQANLSSLKTTIGTYLMQAITPVLQVINMILGKLIDLANMIGKVFGLKDRYSLADSIGSVDTSGFEDVYNGGKEAIKGAVDEQNKLTDATNNTTAATNKAAEAAKKALAPFHKLNILSSNKDSGSGAGSGAGGGAPSGVGVGSAIKVGKIDTKGANEVVSAWVEALKEAIKNGEWYAVGVLLASKANEVVESAKKELEKVQPFLKKWAKNIADIVNGFVSEFDWTNLGSTVATGINTITSAILEFTKNVNWNNLGVGLSEFFRGLLRDTDWEAVGEFWTEKTRILIEILSGFVKDMSEVNPDTGLTGWQELGISLYKIIDGMINNIPWDTLGSTIAGALNGISDAIIKFVDRFDAADAVSKIVSGINTAILEFDATKFTTAASGLINELFEALKTAITEMNWFNLGSTIGEAIFGTLAKINWDDVADTIEGALNAALDFAGMFVVALNKNQDKIKEGITKVFDKVVSWLSDEENQKAILSTINGLIDSVYDILVDQDWSGLYDALYSIFSGIEWGKLLTTLNFPDIIATAIGGEKVLAAAKKALGGLLKGIVSFIIDFNPLGIGWTIGSNIIEGLIEGITGNSLEIPSISDIFFGFIDWIKGIFGVASPSKVFAEIGGFLIEGLINGITGMWENLKSFFAESIPTLISDIKTKFDELRTSLATTWDTITTYAGTKWEEIKTSIGTSVDTVKSSVETKWEEIKTNLSTAWDTITTYAGTKWEEIKTSIVTSVDNVKESIGTKWEEIKTNLSTAWDTIKSNAGTKWEEIKTTISGVVDTLKTSLGTKWEEIKLSVSTAWDTIKSNAGTKWEEIKSTISGVVDNLRTDIESKWDTLKTNTVSVFDGIKSGIVNAFTTISSSIKNPINSVISLVESMVNKIISGVNSAIDTLNNFSIEVPSGVPAIGGQKWGFNLSKLSSISIPRLANGAVIKPNQRFLAELGDQTKGVNIETPLDTMLDAFRGALSEYNGTGDIVIPIYVNDELNSEEIIRRQDIARYRSNGK